MRTRVKWGSDVLLAALKRELHFVFAHGALETQYDLLRRLRLLVEDGLGLSTVTALLAVVAPLALRRRRVLALLVLRDLVRSAYSVSDTQTQRRRDVRVLAAGLALAVYSIRGQRRR